MVFSGFSRVWISGKGAGFKIQRSWVQVPFTPLANVACGGPEPNSSAPLVNSQLVCLPVGIFKLVMFI